MREIEREVRARNREYEIIRKRGESERGERERETVSETDRQRHT